MAVIEAGNRSFDIDDDLLARFDSMAGPETEPISDRTLNGLCLQCGNDYEKIVDLYKFVILVRLMKPCDARVVSMALPRYRLSELMDIASAGKALRTAA